MAARELGHVSLANARLHLRIDVMARERAGRRPLREESLPC
jgi:hypothetical protein